MKRKTFYIVLFKLTLVSQPIEGHPINFIHFITFLFVYSEIMLNFAAEIICII